MITPSLIEIMVLRVITPVITPITPSSRIPKHVITVKGVITPVITGVICDHTVITKYFYWGWSDYSFYNCVLLCSVEGAFTLSSTKTAIWSLIERFMMPLLRTREVEGNKDNVWCGFRGGSDPDFRSPDHFH